MSGGEEAATETQALDLIVIGTGTAGRRIAHRCREAGWSVAIVDERAFGGTCPLRGCVPKKVLAAAAGVVDRTVRMDAKGIRGAPALDWPALQAFKRTFTEPYPEQALSRLVDAGIEPHHGRARFVGPLAVEVGGETLEARHVAIATGARPRPLEIPGSELLTTSDGFLELDELPGSILFVGGGYISFELAHVAARAGAETTIVHREHAPLDGFDPDLVDMLSHRSRALGIDLHLTTDAVAVERAGERLRVRARAAGADETFEADMVVHGAGRVPDLDGLDLEAAGIDRGADGVTVNGYLQSVSNPAVYAAGDAAAGAAALTPVASYQADVAADNLLEGNHRKADYGGVPRIVFTTPPLAGVGLREDEARAAKLAFETRHEKTGDWFTSRHVGETCAGHKLMVETATGRILGAHLLGPRADELINVFALAIRSGLDADDLRDAIFGYPTSASDVASMLA